MFATYSKAMNFQNPKFRQDAQALVHQTKRDPDVKVLARIRQHRADLEKLMVVNGRLYSMVLKQCGQLVWADWRYIYTFKSSQRMVSPKPKPSSM